MKSCSLPWPNWYDLRNDVGMNMSRSENEGDLDPDERS